MIRSPRLLRIVLGGTLGLLVVVGPWLLHHCATGAVRRAVARTLSRRLGADVRVGRVRPHGPFRLVVERLELSWPGPGVARVRIPELTLSLSPLDTLKLSPRLGAVAARDLEIRWWRYEAVAELRMLMRRVLSRRDGGRRRGRKKRLALEVGVESLDLRELGRGAASYGLRQFEGRSLRVWRSEKGRWGGDASSLTARGWEGLAIQFGRFVWRGRDRRGGGLRLSRLRVAAGEVHWPGDPPERRAFALQGDEVAPDLFQIWLRSPVGPVGLGHRVPLNRRGTVGVESALDGLKRTAAFRGGGWTRIAVLAPWARRAGIALEDAEVRGRLQGKASDAGLKVAGQVQVTDLALSHRLLAPWPVRWPAFGARLQLRYERETARLHLESTELRLRGIPVRVSGWLTRRGGGVQLQGAFTLASVACDRLFAALPAGMMPQLEGLRLSGQVGLRGRVSLDSRRWQDLDLAMRWQPMACRVTHEPPGAQVSKLGAPFRFVSRPPGWKPTLLVMGPQSANWRSLRALGSHIPAAFLAAEDQRFYRHEGFDLENIRKALIGNLTQRVLRRGASSISQQVVKNVFLSHRRDLSRKLQEAILTWQMERRLDKGRILEIYLNLVELGPGIFGVRAASQHYFGLEPRQLAPIQAAHLAAITPGPRLYYPRFGRGRVGPKWRRQLRVLLYQMRKMGRLDRELYHQFKNENLNLIIR